MVFLLTYQNYLQRPHVAGPFASLWEAELAEEALPDDPALSAHVLEDAEALRRFSPEWRRRLGGIGGVPPTPGELFAFVARAADRPQLLKGKVR